jgi:uncharacterized membrane protein
MWQRLRGLWQRLMGSLWFVPGLMVLGAIVLAILMVYVSGMVKDDVLERFPRLFGANAESSRSMLATIAGSMITVAGVTFSIVVVAVAQASQQYTPRILRNFLRDRPSQLVLGILAGVFVYCLVVLRTIRGVEDIRFVPSVAVLVAFLLAIVAIAFLVYFIHHIAGQLEAASILERIGHETTESVDAHFADPIGHTAADGLVPPSSDAPWRPVPSRHTGYIQSIDESGMLHLARKLDVVVRMEHGVGEFVIKKLPLVSVLGDADDDECRDGFNRLFTVAAYRTVFQDVEFGIRQMVDIALKALSPSMNDTTTAVNCVDHISAALARLGDRRVEEPRRADEDGTLRIVARGPTYEGLLNVAFNEIRRSSRDNVNLLTRLLTRLRDVVIATPDPYRRALLRQHADRILRAAEHHVELAEDREPVQRAHDHLMSTLRETSTETARLARVATAH